MSTKSTLGYGRNWHLFEEMVTGEVRLERGGYTMTIPDNILDAIADLHNRKKLPHQQPMVSDGVLSEICNRTDAE